MINIRDSLNRYFNIAINCNESVKINAQYSFLILTFD